MLKKILIAVPVLLATGAGGVYWYINDRAKSVVDERLDALVTNGSYDALAYEDMQIHMNGDITMTNLNVVQGPLEYTLRNINIANFDYANEFPRHMDVSIDGLQLPALDANSADPQVATLSTLLDSLGTGPEVPLSVNYSHRYDPDNAHQTASTMHLAITDAFTLDLNSITRNLQMQALNGVDAPDPDADPARAQAQLMALLADAEIPSMDLTLQDEGFLDGIIATGANRLGVAPEDYRNLLVSQVRNFYLFLPQNAQQLAMSAGTELATFLEGGKSLSVSIAPEYGGNIRRLQEEIMGAVFTGDYDHVGDLLNLEISAQ